MSRQGRSKICTSTHVRDSELDIGDQEGDEVSQISDERELLGAQTCGRETRLDREGGFEEVRDRYSEICAFGC